MAHAGRSLGRLSFLFLLAIILSCVLTDRVGQRGGDSTYPSIRTIIDGNDGGDYSGDGGGGPGSGPASGDAVASRGATARKLLTEDGGDSDKGGNISSPNLGLSGSGSATGCPDGFAGVNCHACEEDTYSGGCTEHCNDDTTCSGNGRCRGKDGTCICDEGWTGANCNGEGSGSMSGSDMHPTCACGKHGRCEADGSCVCESGFFDRRFCGFVLSLRCVVAGAPRDERDQVSADHACVIRFRRAEM